MDLTKLAGPSHRVELEVIYQENNENAQPQIRGRPATELYRYIESTLKYVLNCKAQGHVVYCTVDSRSSVCTLSQETANALNLIPDNSNIKIYDYAGREIQNLGKVLMQIEIDRLSLVIEAVVLSNDLQTMPLILGQSYVRQQFVIVVIKDGAMNIYNELATKVQVIHLQQIEINSSSSENEREDAVPKPEVSNHVIWQYRCGTGVTRPLVIHTAYLPKYHKICKINGYRTYCYVDTGNRSNTISSKTVRELELNQERTNRLLFDFTSASHRTERVRIQIEVDRIKVNCEALIVPDSLQTTPIILGHRFIANPNIITILKGKFFNFYDKQKVNLVITENTESISVSSDSSSGPTDSESSQDTAPADVNSVAKRVRLI